MLRRALFIFFFFVVMTAPFSRGGATTVLPLSLERLAAQAERIFVGRCQGVSTELDERGVPATYARFQVEEGLKGVAGGGTVLIKQFGASRPELKVAEGESVLVSPKTMTLAGASYRPGASYLLFLYPESDWGFTSPVGGGQGRFEIDGSGASALTVNPLDNRFLKTFRDGPVPLDRMIGEIRTIVDR
ncbi:MAG TPA: hypothetical protein VLJ37_08420 [bacterium]|nr:hypothetical protein [bacterium]